MKFLYIILIMFFPFTANAALVTDVNFSRSPVIVDRATGTKYFGLTSFIGINTDTPYSLDTQTFAPNGSSLFVSYNFFNSNSISGFEITSSYTAVNTASVREVSSGTCFNCIPFSFRTTEPLAYTVTVSQNMTSSTGSAPFTAAAAVLSPNGFDILTTSTNTSYYSSGFLSENTYYGFTALTEISLFDAVNAPFSASGTVTGTSHILLTLSPVSSVPIPATVWLFGSGLVGLKIVGKKKPVRGISA